MNEPVAFRVDTKPIPKPRPRVTKNGVFYSRNQQDNERLIQLSAAEAMQGKEILTGPVGLDCAFYIPLPRGLSVAQRDRQGGSLISKRPDIDNYIKQVMDACNGIVWEDDGQVSTIKSTKRYVLPGGQPQIVVFVNPLKGDQQW